MLSKEEFKKTYIRMMDSVRKEDSVYKGKGRCSDVNCEDCPLERLCRNNTTLIFSAFEFIDAVEKWGKEHPVITRADKFKEVFGYEPHDSVYSNYPCPNSMGANFRDCSFKTCADCKKDYWEDEYAEPKKDGEPE